MQIHARFRLDEVTRIKMYALAKEPQSDGQKWVPVEGVRVKLSPVTGEPFGSATPSGELMMVIANPEVIAEFHNAPLEQEYDALFTPRKE